jgi:Fic family protein
MQLKDADRKQRIGEFNVSVSHGETVRAYVPRPLPPIPALDLTSLLAPIERANRSLGRLDGMTSVLPAPELFVYMFIRKEALLSSQIEGTQSSLSDLLLFETDELSALHLDDVVEVSNYIAALNSGLARLNELPLSLRLIREMHQRLLTSGRGSSKQPGEFRTTQNWIGGSRPGTALFVPPPPHRLAECLSALEHFLHDRETYPVLLRAAMVHVQFETIHPFLDGNGRLGRLLIILMLCEEKALQAPILYLSLYLKQNRDRYYELLQAVRLNGAWEDWVAFFLQGVIEVAEQGVTTGNRLLALFEADHTKIAASGRGAASAMRVHKELQRVPLISVSQGAETLGLSQPTLQKALEQMQALGIVREVTGKRRGRLYQYSEYLKILDEGTEPLST